MSVSTFNCTNCGAGQDLLGGGRVRVHVCGYCGAELDVQDRFKVIAQFRDMIRPESPFDLGMTGTLWGVEFTVIGTIGWFEQYGSTVWTWVDHQIYSPTHGYAWLTVEDSGHAVYARKIRRMPHPALLGAATIEHAEHRPTVTLEGKTYRYYGSGHARPTFIEGAFNYVPSMNDRVRYVDLLGGREMLSIVEDGKEREYELSTLPDQVEIMQSFGIAPDRLPVLKSTHPLEVFERSGNGIFIRDASFIGAAVALVITIVLFSLGNRVVQTAQLPVDTPISLPFEITRGDRLTEIEIHTNASNSWATFEAELIDENGQIVAGFEDLVEFYSGTEGGEHWSEGNRTGSTTLKLPSGRYTMELEYTEGDVWANGRTVSTMAVEVTEGRANPWWVLAAAVTLGLIGGAFLFQRGLHNAQRWAGSDWSDD